MNDTLIGNALANTLTGGPGNDTITGGAGNDTYLFDADVGLGLDTLNETGGGTDTLDFSSTTTLGLNVNLGNTTDLIVNSNLTLIIGTGTYEKVIGGSQNDSLAGTTGSDTLEGGPGNDTLTGGAGNDTYLFDADTALGSDTLNESGGGVDLLDFSATLSLGVTVNLATASSQTVNSNLSLTLSAGNTFEMVLGSALNDTLSGNALNNVLFGGAGNDTISGVGGRDLLVGGTGTDTITGGDEEDILISGTLSFFNESTKVLNRTAIDAIMAEWSRTNTNSGYAARLANLRNGGGLNGTNRIDSGTSLTDGAAVDSLTGGLGLDWFWSFSDTVNDLNAGGTETVN